MSSPDEVTLADLIDRAMQRHGVTSARALAQAAQDRGLPIVHTTLSQIRAGSYRSRPSRATLEGVAELAGVPYRVAQHAAGLPVVGKPFHQEWDTEYDELTPDQRDVVKTVAAALLNASRRRNTATDDGDDDGVAYAYDDDAASPDGSIRADRAPGS